MDRNQKSWSQHSLKDPTEEKSSEPKKDPDLQSEQAEHIPGTIARKMTRVVKNSHQLQSRK